jgi:glucose/mannose transport system substrate-binding protein
VVSHLANAGPLSGAREIDPVSGSEARLHLLIEAHVAPLARHLTRFGVAAAEVDDVIQEALIVVSSKLDQVRPGSERAFLFATAGRIASNARRGGRRRDRMSVSLLETGSEPPPNAEDRIDELLGRSLLEDSLDHMPQDVALVFFLAELQEMAVPNVAARLGLPEGTVASRLRRARSCFDEWAARTRSSMGHVADAARTKADSGRSSTGDPADTEILSWWVQRGEADALRALLGVYDRFHPRHRSIMSATVDDKAHAQTELASRMLQGKPPDTFQVNGGNALFTWVKRTTSGEQMQPIDFLFASEGWGRVFPSDVLDLVSHRGRAYAVPLNLHRTNSLFYNRRIFARADLPPPTTLDELHEVADALRRQGVVPFAMGNRDPWTLTMLAFEAILVGDAGPGYYREFFGGRQSPEDPEIRSALDHVARILDYANDDAADLRWDAALDLMSSGRAAMTIMGDWAKGYLITKGCRMGEDFGQTGAPGTAPAFVFATDVFGLPKRANHPGEAIDLLKVFGSKEGQTAFNQLKGSIPARVDVDVASYDVHARASMRDFWTGPRVPSMTSLVPSGFALAVHAAMGVFARSRDAAAVVSVLRANYDLLRG